MAIAVLYHIFLLLFFGKKNISKHFAFCFVCLYIYIYILAYSVNVYEPSNRWSAHFPLHLMRVYFAHFPVECFTWDRNFSCYTLLLSALFCVYSQDLFLVVCYWSNILCCYWRYNCPCTDFCDFSIFASRKARCSVNNKCQTLFAERCASFDN